MRQKFPDSHEFAQLPAGRCHYRLEGPAGGRPVLLIHGATVPAWEFDRIVPYLTAAGYRTIQPDLYGHGYSARPDVTHDYALFTDQLTHLLDTLGLTAGIHLVGHSLGAVVAARLLLAEPRRYGVLVMAAPMLDFTATARTAAIVQLPVLGELLVRHYVVPMLVRRRTRRYRDIEDGRYVRRFRDQVAVPGFDRSLLSLLRSGALGNQRECYDALGALGTPTLLLRGRDDTIVTAAQMRTIGSLLPCARLTQIEDTAHAMNMTHPEKVAPHILGFLADGARGGSR